MVLARDGEALPPAQKIEFCIMNHQVNRHTYGYAFYFSASLGT